MKLSEILKKYRSENGLSQREFARQAGLSNSLISLIEKGVNPQTGKEMSQDMETYKKLSDGMGISMQSLFEKLGDDAAVKIITERKIPKGMKISTPTLRVGKFNKNHGKIFSRVPIDTQLPAVKILNDNNRVISVEEDPELASILKIWKVTKPERKKEIVRVIKAMTEEV